MDNIRTLDLNLLRVLDALLDTRSVTHAARKLGMTQPAISGMLARLRLALDDPLFIRKQRGILPTPRAEALGGPLKLVLAEIETLLQPASFDPASARMTVSIAATDYAQRTIVLPMLLAMRSDAPDIRVSVRPVDPESFAEQIAEGSLDMALVTPEMAPETLRFRKLYNEDYVLVLRRGHPAATSTIDLDVFCALDHAIMSHDGTNFRGATDVALGQLGRRRRVVTSVPSFTVLVDLIAHSDIVALLPRKLAEYDPRVILHEPPLAIPGFEKILVWSERLHFDPGQIWLRQRISEASSHWCRYR